jgi:hypothetical protein
LIHAPIQFVYSGNYHYNSISSSSMPFLRLPRTWPTVWYVYAYWNAYGCPLSARGGVRWLNGGARRGQPRVRPGTRGRDCGGTPDQPPLQRCSTRPSHGASSSTAPRAPELAADNGSAQSTFSYSLIRYRFP